MFEKRDGLLIMTSFYSRSREIFNQSHDDTYSSILVSECINL